MGLDYGVEHHRFESPVHSISVEDEERLVATVTERADSEPGFWSDYVQRASTLGSRLIATARSSSSPAEEPRSHADLLEGFLGLTEAMQEMAPFVVAASPVLGVLTSLVADSVAAESGASSPEQKASELLPRLLIPWREPDPVGDMRDGYRIALAVRRSAEATELFLNTTPGITLDRVVEEFPDLHRMIRGHVEEYGWLRAQGYRCDPLSPETLIYRIQLVLLRCPTAAIREAARPAPVPCADQVLGFRPSESLAGQIAALQSMLSKRCLRAEAHLRAECVARPFLGRIAGALGCTPRQILFASVDEILAALAHRAELPIGEIDARARNGFGVQRDHDTVVVQAASVSPTDRGGVGAGTGVLRGMTACRGTAVGRVRIVLDQADLFRLEVGDVLVTAASTIDPTDETGAGTVFPTRTGGPHDDGLGRAAAVVADEGGLLSHAAIVCRERGLPCVLGTDLATTTLVDGQVVEVDATKPVGLVIAL